MTVDEATADAIKDPAVFAIAFATEWVRPRFLRKPVVRRTLDYYRQVRTPSTKQLRIAIAQRYIIVDAAGELLRVEELRITPKNTAREILWSR